MKSRRSGAAVPAPRQSPAVSTPRPGPTHLRRDAVLLFLGLWLLYGAGINKLNLQGYTLHPEVVMAIAEEGTFVIGHQEVPKENDRFLFDGNVLPAKQPWIFALGAAAYLPVRALGLTYDRDFFLAEAVITWLTASLFAAVAAAAALVVARRVWGFRRRDALLAVLAGAACTILLPYAGIPHHDVVATALLVLALAAFEVARSDEAAGTSGKARRRLMASGLAGLFLGLMLGFSMLPAAIALGVIVAIAATRNRSIVVPAAGGFVLGLLPLALYNGHYFHTPFLQANLAGQYDDTYPGFAPERIVHHLNAYLGVGEVSILKYMPILLAGAAGLVLLVVRGRAPGRLLLTLLLLHGMYLLAIPAIGYCQYGPRFLLPAVPLAAFGLAPLLEALDRLQGGWRLAGAALVALLALASLMVNLVGTVGGTMYCAIEEFAFPRYVAVLADPQAWTAIATQFPLLGFCSAGLLLLGVAGFGGVLLARGRAASLDASVTGR